MSDQSSRNKTQFVDVEKVFASKDARLLRRIPKFLIRYLKKIVHQNEINELLTATDGLNGIEFIEYCIKFWDIKIDIIGAEQVPKDSRLIFAANHPLGGIDGLCLLRAIHFTSFPEKPVAFKMAISFIFS